MTRIAVITDIHGNLPALEASLEALDAIDVDEVYCGGDLVGYGPHPNEVCALIRERGIPTIYGNYDYAIARDLDDCGCAYVTQHDRERPGCVRSGGGHLNVYALYSPNPAGCCQPTSQSDFAKSPVTHC